MFPDGVMADRLAVVLGQQVRPAAVAVGVSFGLQTSPRVPVVVGVN